MANLSEIAESYVPSKFVRLGENIYIGNQHREILEDLGWGDDTETIKERLEAEGGIDIDMGFIMRSFGKISIGESSGTYKYPPKEIFEMVRERTMEVLRNKYDEEVFTSIKY